MKNNAQKFNATKMNAVKDLSQEAILELPHLGDSEAMLSRKEVRAKFEEVFHSFGPFERNDSIDQTYKNPVHMAMYVAFVQTLRETRGRLNMIISSVQRKSPVQPPFVIIRNDIGGTITAAGKPRTYSHQSQACAEARKLVDKFGSSFSVYGVVNTYAPKEKVEKEAVVKRETKTTVLNPMTVINRLFEYLDKTPDDQRPDHAPVAVNIRDDHVEVVLKNGKATKYQKPVNAYRVINDFLLLNTKHAPTQNSKAAEPVGGKKPQQKKQKPKPVNPALKNVDPHSPHLTEQEKIAIMEESRTNPDYYLRHVVKPAVTTVASSDPVIDNALS